MTTQSAATPASRAVPTCVALASARPRTASPGELSDPNAARTASSSTPETATSGSMPSRRSTLSRPADADPSTRRVIGGIGWRHSSASLRSASSSAHVGPFQQGDLLPAEDGITQLVDGQPPPVVFGWSRFTAAADGAAQHRDQRGQLLVGRLALEHPDVRLVCLRLVLVAHRGWIVRLVPVTHCV